MRNVFGWDYPPGCHSVPGDEPEPPCGVCGKVIDDCICPECPECGEVGRPQCYPGHGLTRNTEQQIGYSEQKVAELKQEIADIEEYIGYLKDKEASHE